MFAAVQQYEALERIEAFASTVARAFDADAPLALGAPKRMRCGRCKRAAEPHGVSCSDRFAGTVAVVLKLPLDPLHWATPIVDKNGRPAQEFMRKREAQRSINDTIPNVSGGAAGALFYKLSANNLDVGWTTGLLWDEVNDSLTVGAAGYTLSKVSNVPGASDTSPALKLYSNGSAAYFAIPNGFLGVRGAADNQPTEIGCWKARGSLSTPTKVSTNDLCAFFSGRGYGDTNYKYAAQLKARVIDPSPSDTAMGGQWEFFVSAVGAVDGGTAVAKTRATGNRLIKATTVGADADPTASAALDVNSTTGAFMPPRMTTTQRTALTASNGMEVYDTTVDAFFDYTVGAWVQRGSGGGGTGTNVVMLPNVNPTSSDTWGTNLIILTPVWLRAGSIIQKIGVWGRTTAPVTWSVGVYDGTATTIGNLLGTQAGGTTLTGDVVNLATLTSPITVAADGLYWIGVWMNTTGAIWSNSNRKQAFWTQVGGVWPATAPAFSTNNNGAGIVAQIQMP